MKVDEVLEWLMERKDNCDRIAGTKTGAEGAGWKQDASYFLAAAKLIADAYPEKPATFHEGRPR